MKTHIHKLFHTPLTYYEGFLPSNIASNITDYILTRNTAAVFEHQAFLGNAYTAYTSQVNTNILQDIVRVPGCSDVFKNLTECINEYTNSNGFPICNIDNSWFNVQKPGSLLKRHFHLGGSRPSFVSGALYINVDEKSPPVTFENPNPYIILKYPPTNNYLYSFKPNVGDLILFPSWLFHFSDQLNMTENRIVISLNAN